MPHGAVALAVVLCAGSGAGASVTVVNLSWQFYQGGLAQENNESFIIEQDTYDNLATNEVARTLGGVTFSSVASITNTTLLGTGTTVFTTNATMNAAAQTPAELPEGLAEAFAGLSIFDIGFEIADTPHVYKGVHLLEGEDGSFGDGSLLQPGFYSFLHFHPFALDAHVQATPGQSISEEKLRSFRFEFREVPGPAAAALLPAAAIAALRRRRP